LSQHINQHSLAAGGKRQCGVIKDINRGHTKSLHTIIDSNRIRIFVFDLRLSIFDSRLEKETTVFFHPPWRLPGLCFPEPHLFLTVLMLAAIIRHIVVHSSFNPGITSGFLFFPLYGRLSNPVCQEFCLHLLCRVPQGISPPVELQLESVGNSLEGIGE
jgi:hypothetical protein